MTKPRWVTKEVVLAIHKRQIAEHGGKNGVRDHTILESGLAKPENRQAYGGPEPSLAELAAAYAVGIGGKQAFNDGNKRTAMVTYRLFLKLNGVEVVADPGDEYRINMDLAAGDLTEAEMAEWIASKSQPALP